MHRRLVYDELTQRARFFKSVMPGLGPGIHRAEASNFSTESEPGRSVDRRAKPGDDDFV